MYATGTIECPLVIIVGYGESHFQRKRMWHFVVVVVCALFFFSLHPSFRKHCCGITLSLKKYHFPCIQQQHTLHTFASHYSANSIIEVGYLFGAEQCFNFLAGVDAVASNNTHKMILMQIFGPFGFIFREMSFAWNFICTSFLTAPTTINLFSLHRTKENGERLRATGILQSVKREWCKWKQWNHSEFV